MDGQCFPLPCVNSSNQDYQMYECIELMSIRIKQFVYFYDDKQPVHHAVILCRRQTFCAFMMTSNQFIMQLYCAGGRRPSVLLKFQRGTSVCYEGSRAGHLGEMANNRQ